MGGKKLPIEPDFRNVITILEAMSDGALSGGEKAYICLKRLYRAAVPEELCGAAIQAAVWFCDGGDMPKSKPERVRILDWKHDEQLIFPAVSRAAGVVDIRELPRLHWWTFLGLFGEIGEGLFSAVLSLRQKLARGEKLERHEREFLRRNRELVVLRTAEEQAEIDETTEFLKLLTQR